MNAKATIVETMGATELTDEVVSRVVEELRPLIEQSSKPLLVDASEIARLCTVSTSTIDRWQREGIIPSVKAGKSRRYNPEKVLDALEAREGGR